MGEPIALLYVGIVRNDDESKVVAASSYDPRQLGKNSLKAIEDYVRQELAKDGLVRRFEVAALSAYTTVEQVDLTSMGGRKWAIVVCATRAYTENNALNCGQEIAMALDSSIEHQQDLEEWASKKRGGASHGLSKKFGRWMDSIRNKWGARPALTEDRVPT